MKNYLLLLSILISSLVYSQTMTRDIVYLKNGTILKGQIKEINLSGDLKIESSDGSLFVYKVSEVLKMEKENFIGQEMNQNKIAETVSQKAMDNYFLNFLTQKRPALKFIGVSKKNGIKKDVFGQKIYEIEYELIMDVIDDIYISTSQFASAYSNNFNQDFSYTKNDASGYEAAFNGKKEKLSKAQRISASGILNFEETDNGWRATGHKNKNFKTVSTNYLTPEIVELKKEKLEKINQERKIIIESKNELNDWGKNDTEEYKTIPVFLKVENIPMFEEAMIKFRVSKLSESCTDCRNDNLTKINQTIINGINNSNRFIPAQAHNFVYNVNTSDIIFFIKNIIYEYKIKKDESGSGYEGYTCTINYDISSKSKLIYPNKFDYSKNESLSVSSSDGYLSRESSLNYALERMETQVKVYLYKSEQLALNVSTIEIDKKGNPEFVVFETPKKIFDLNKIEFMLIEKSALKLKDNQFKLDFKITDLTYEKSHSPNIIKCEIKNRKIRELLIKYVGRENELLGISKY